MAGVQSLYSGKRHGIKMKGSGSKGKEDNVYGDYVYRVWRLELDGQTD